VFWLSALFSLLGRSLSGGEPLHAACGRGAAAEAALPEKIDVGSSPNRTTLVTSLVGAADWLKGLKRVELSGAANSRQNESVLRLGGGILNRPARVT
jgi:hypothetical protein